MYNKINLFLILGGLSLSVCLNAAQGTNSKPQFDISQIKTAKGNAIYARVTNVLTLNANQLKELFENSPIEKRLPKSGDLILDLSGKGLNALPEEIGDYPNITFLNLRNNYLQDLPQSFSQLKGLRQLDLSNNKFTTLPSSLIMLEELDKLSMNGNKGFDLSSIIRAMPRVVLYEN